MADVTIHDVDPAALERFKATAEANGHSVEEELRAIIENRTRKLTIEETRLLAREWQERFRGQSFSDSTELIREDRER
jgi:plasmid stability protein